MDRDPLSRPPPPPAGARGPHEAGSGPSTGGWRIAADTGGTFTDCVATAPDGSRRSCKLLSSGSLRTRVTHVDRGDDDRRPPGAPVVWRLGVADDWGTANDVLDGFLWRVVGNGDGGRSAAGHVVGWRAAGRELDVVIAPSGIEATGSGGDGPPSLLPSVGGIIELFTGEEAPVVGARMLTGTRPGARFPPLSLRVATTRGTNALLEGRTARVALLTTAGFGDLLEIGDQRRGDLFALRHVKPPVLAERVHEIPGRLDASGRELVPLDESAIRAAAASLRAEGIGAVAVAFAHAYRNGEHERRAASLLRSAGLSDVSVSSDLSPLIKLHGRARTAVIDAALAPVLSRFVEGVSRAIGDACGLHLMTSAGGLEPAARFRPKDGLLSGPAGGVAGALAVGRSVGCERLIAFDMGGTSTDVARLEGAVPFQFQHAVGGHVLFAPSIRIETVAAGGGSICSLKPTGLSVGPESAGADPGPACYGNGGPLTLTDVNLLLGRFHEIGASIPIDRAAAERRLAWLRAEMEAAGHVVESDRRLLEGLLEIAVERMSEAIRRISIREGYRPSEYALVAFGGAGPQHACAVADRLGITRVIVGAEAGILSAVGVDRAAFERFAERQVLRPLSELSAALGLMIDELTQEAMDRLVTDGCPTDDVRRGRVIAELRLAGQESALAVDLDDGDLHAPADRAADRFCAAFRQVFGYEPPARRSIELVALRCLACSERPEAVAEALGTAPEIEVPASGRPVVLQGATSTTVVEPGWQGFRGVAGTLVLERLPEQRAGAPATADGSRSPDAVETELFRSRFQGIVDQMGAALRRTAVSTNVKEREDFSCAILDAAGRLVLNAPHIPVHLGALGLCVREVEACLPMGPGDMAVTNHPGFGGSHLPDITVISPVHDTDGRRVAFVANRAHHAEIGGMAPGSMPPDAGSLAREGVVIEPRLLYRNGVPAFEGVEALLRGGRFPSRSVADNLADLNAQAAANLNGVSQLAALVGSAGTGVVARHLARLRELAAESLADALRRRPVSDAEVEERLDDGSCIRVALHHAPDAGGGRLRISLAGSSPAVHPAGFNATPAIVRSAVLYVLRLFAGSELPLNEGLLDLVDLDLPPSFLAPVFPEDPEKAPAVVAGNVETSQRLVDALVRAFGLQACSQGTMNNVIFGNERFGYYETIGGGAGAGEGYHGASGLHTHMTNTAITDVEIIESRYPVRIECFALRRGSGGRGRWHGGDGLVRDFRFLEPLTVSLLTQHRIEAPFGLAGGGAGARGRQTLVRAGDGGRRLDGEEELPPCVRLDVAPGDRLRIETPGGGGFGSDA